MMRLLTGFAALSLVSGALMALLPEGAMKKTASMAVGLMMLLYWAGSLASLFGDLSVLSDLPAPLTPLVETGVTLPTAAPTEGSP